MASRNRSNSKNTRFVSSASRLVVQGPYCGCGSATLVRVVKKLGLNNGRKFWGCKDFGGTFAGPGCNYHMWYEDWCPNAFTNEECLCCREYNIELREKNIELCEKNMELISLKKLLIEMQEHHKSTKDQMKIVIVTCLVLGVICAMVFFMLLTTRN